KKMLGMSNQLALAMGVDSVRVARDKGWVNVEVTLPRQLVKVLKAEHLKQKGGTWVTLGRTPAGLPVSVNLAGTRTCQTLIAGTTGCGKTFTQLLIAWALAKGQSPDKTRLILIDGKGGVKWRGFTREAHLAHPIISTAQEGAEALGRALAELGRRKDTGQCEPRIFILIDEVRELLELDDSGAIAAALARLTTMGRELGLHVIMSTQHPNVKSVGESVTKANLVMRIAGRATNSQAAYAATGVKGSGAEGLAGNGDMLVCVAGRVIRVQVGLLKHKELFDLERTEETARLDFSDYDLNHVLDVAPACTPEQMAVALINPKVRYLKRTLSVGQGKAGPIAKFAKQVLAALGDRGYSVYPVPRTL
ncbi:MAG: hypothetical protein DRP56_10535, partial [Planctomycetota bacterium]